MNYLIIIVLLLFSFPIFIDVYGQQGSRDLMAEYCSENWIKDPVRCADYVPKDYEERKSEYQAIESEKTRQEALQSKSEQESQRVCPLGSHLGKDDFGNQVCLDSKTNQFVSYPNTGEADFGDNGMIIGIVVIAIIIIVAGIAVARRKSEQESYKDVERKDFPFATKERVKELQKGKCAICERYPTHWEFDHIDTRGDNSIENCQGLCRDCHQKKTLDDNWRNARN